MQMMPKHIFWPIIDCSVLYTSGVTRNQSVVLRRIGGHGHFRSRDKDGSHTVPLFSKPSTPTIRKLHGSIFYRTGVIAD